jgi:hypothetical protein
MLMRRYISTYPNRVFRKAPVSLQTVIPGEEAAQGGDLLYNGAMRHQNPMLSTIRAVAQYHFWLCHMSSEAGAELPAPKGPVQAESPGWRAANRGACIIYAARSLRIGLHGRGDLAGQDNLRPKS